MSDAEKPQPTAEVAEAIETCLQRIENSEGINESHSIFWHPTIKTLIQAAQQSAGVETVSVADFIRSEKKAKKLNDSSAYIMFAGEALNKLAQKYANKPVLIVGE